MKHKPRKKVCRKNQYATERDALRVRDKMIAENLRPYLCPHCSGPKRWHLGTPDK